MRAVESPSESAGGGSGEAVRLREGGEAGAGVKVVRACTTSAMVYAKRIAGSSKELSARWEES